jgi:hypothetical protein
MNVRRRRRRRLLLEASQLMLLLSLLSSSPILPRRKEERRRWIPNRSILVYGESAVAVAAEEGYSKDGRRSSDGGRGDEDDVAEGKRLDRT